MRRPGPLVVAFLACGASALGVGTPRAWGEPPPAAGSPAPAPKAPAKSEGWHPGLKALPDDPPERGPCTLALTVLVEGREKPLYGSVDLWRLDVPGDALWLPGDHLQTTVRIHAGKGEATGLPEGRYRAVYDGQRRVDDDPPPFAVRGPRTEVTLRVALPREFAGSLRLVDENGVPLKHATLRRDGLWSWKYRGDPAWVKPRMLVQPEGFNTSRWPVGGSGSGTFGGSHRTYQPIHAAGDLFALGPFEEPDKEQRPHRELQVAAAGSNRVRVILGDGATGPTTHLGVALPLELLLARLALPDGSPVLGSAAEVEATSDAEVMTPATPADRWRRLPVKVTVTIPGYEPLELTADADHPSPMPPPWVYATGAPALCPF